MNNFCVCCFLRFFDFGFDIDVVEEFLEKEGGIIYIFFVLFWGVGEVFYLFFVKIFVYLYRRLVYFKIFYRYCDSFEFIEYISKYLLVKRFLYRMY